MIECPSCGTTKVERNGYCASCNHEQRKAERNASKVKVVVPIKKVSATRAKENQVYARLRKEYLEAYPCCEVPECHRKSSEIHHQKGRNGDLLMNTDYFMAVCHEHHHMITVDSKWAIEQGYSFLRSTTEP